MQYIFVVVCFLVTAVGMSFVRSLDLGAGLTVALVFPQIFLVIYSLARIKPQEPEVEQRIAK